MVNFCRHEHLTLICQTLNSIFLYKIFLLFFFGNMRATCVRFICWVLAFCILCFIFKWKTWSINCLIWLELNANYVNSINKRMLNKLRMFITFIFTVQMSPSQLPILAWIGQLQNICHMHAEHVSVSQDINEQCVCLMCTSSAWRSKASQNRFMCSAIRGT